MWRWKFRRGACLSASRRQITQAPVAGTPPQTRARTKPENEEKENNKNKPLYVAPAAFVKSPAFLGKRPSHSSYGWNASPRLLSRGYSFFFLHLNTRAMLLFRRNPIQPIHRNAAAGARTVKSKVFIPSPGLQLCLRRALFVAVKVVRVSTPYTWRSTTHNFPY